MWLPQVHLYPYFLAQAFAPNCMNSSRVSIHGHCFHVNGCQIEQPRWTETWNQYPERGPHPNPPSSQNGPEDPEAFQSTPSQSPSQSLVRKPDCPEIWYCLEIQVISTEDKRAAPPPAHVWQVPIVENMVWDGKAGLTEAVVTGPGHTILFYGQWSLGEGLSLGEAQDTAFTLSGTITWVDKPVQLSAKPGWWLVADHPSHHWRTHWTKRAQSSSFNTTCFNTFQFS